MAAGGAIEMNLCDPLDLKLRNGGAFKRSDVSSNVQPSNLPVIPDTPMIPNTQQIGPENFAKLKLLGAGSFGKVYLAMKKEGSGSEKPLYAIKIFKKHPFIIQMFYAFQTPYELFLVLDFASGGDLAQLQEKNGRTFKEEEVRFFMAESIIAIKYLHSKGIIHRDVKPANILIDNQGHIKMADFSLARQSTLRTTDKCCGTDGYVAPEMLLNKEHGAEVDWWSLGVTMFYMLVAEYPYKVNTTTTFTQQKPTPQSFNLERIFCEEKLEKDGFSQNIINFIGKLVTMSIKKRSRAALRIQAHAFFGEINWTDVEDRKCSPPFVPTPKNEARKEMVESPVQLSVEIKKKKFHGFSYVAPHLRAGPGNEQPGIRFDDDDTGNSGWEMVGFGGKTVNRTNKH